MFYLRYLCLVAQWCRTHIVFCFCFVFLRLPYVASFSGLSIFDAPSVFSNVCLLFVKACVYNIHVYMFLLLLFDDAG